MKMKRNIRSRVLDVLVVLICLAGVVISLQLFWKDLNMTLLKQSEKPVGEIEFKRKNAQRKFTDRVIWDRLQQLSPVYNGDTIRTSDQSEAKVTFTGEVDSIALSDNSIIQIWMDEQGGGLIDFPSGNINIYTQGSSRSFTLVSSGNQISVEGGSLVNVNSRAAKDDLSLTVLEGSASLSNASGVSKTLDAGSALTVGSGGTIETNPGIALLKPFPDSYLLYPSRHNIPVQFNWNTINFTEAMPVRLEVSRDRNFMINNKSIDISNGNETTVTLDDIGTYYWRIYPVSTANVQYANLDNASTGRFAVLYSPAPELVAPAEDYIYRYRTKKPAVRMYWTSLDMAAKYQVEIANNPQMRNPKIVRPRESLMVYSELDAGDWYWRVTPLYPSGFQGSTLPSKTGHFRIEQGGALQAPELLLPVSGGFVNIAGERSNSYFSWKNDPEAVSYTIQISASQNLANPIISKEVTENFYVYRMSQKELKTGQYYWAVYQTDVEGNKSPVSPARPFLALEGEVEYRTTFPPEDYTIAESRLQDTMFTWKSNLPFANRFQISASSDFSSPVINEVINSTSYQGRILPPGEYYWRIVAESGSKVQAFSSSPKKLRIAPPLEAPKAEAPLPGGTLVIRPGTTYDFKWEAVEEAEYYQFKLYLENRLVFENLFAEGISQPYSMDRFQEGEYRWTVQAFISESITTSRRTGLISSNDVSVKKLKPVSLDYPASGHSYQGLAALRSPDSIKWSSVEPVSNSRFILSTSPNPLANVRSIILDIRSPDHTIKLPRLREGIYYWTVIAYTHDDFDISADKPSSFRVLAIPPLPAPRTVTPQNSHVYGPTELRTIRSINFEWQSVQGANIYLFSLHKRDSSGKLVQIIGNQSLAGTSYELKDLSVLDRGTFVWRVEAQSRGSDGGIDQRGNVAETVFVIDLPETGSVKTRDPGALYGN